MRPVLPLAMNCVLLPLTLALLSSACGDPVEPTPKVITPDAQTGADSQELDAEPEVASSGCTVSSDCTGATEQCVDGKCIAQTACQSDKQCQELGWVCDKAAGVCVQCLETPDCAEGHTCKAHHCIPPPKPCASTKECAQGLVCDKPANACVECLTAADCNDGMACQESVCVAQACKPGTTTCTDLAKLKTCKADGSGWSESPCGNGYVCEASAGASACKAQVCAPGEKTCEGSSVVTCNANGTAIASTIPCADKQTCLAGACLAAACKVGQVQCQNGQVASCKADGSGWDAKACGANMVCSEGACVPKACEPGQAFCIGTKKMQCGSSGADAAEVLDCLAISSVKSMCLGGACVPQTCTPGQKTCAGNTLATCKSDGTYEQSPCDDGNACTTDSCDAALGCQSQAIPGCGAVQGGFALRGGFASLVDTAKGGYRLIEQGWLTAGSCKANFCLRGGFQP